MGSVIKTKDIPIPESIIGQWQSVVDTLAKILDVPAGLIMRVDPPNMVVFQSSKSEENPYKVGDKDALPGLYCETVVKGKKMLKVPNALKDPQWDHNPDIKLGMISYLGFPILWSNGDVFGTICVLDKTENHYSDDYRELMVQFKMLVESHLNTIELNHKLQVSNENLIDVNKGLESFSHIVSHDLRAPLRHIKILSEMLSEDPGDSQSSDQKHILQDIIKCSDKMSGLVSGLLEFSKTTKHQIDFKAVNLSEIADDIINELRTVHVAPHVKFIVASDVMANGESCLLSTVLRNLLYNAFKFTVDKKPAVVEFGVTTVDDQSTYFVRDNGAGFDQADQGMLFDLFKRLPYHASFDGTGLGLAVVKRIVNNHGGQIWAEGEQDKGATFYFTLPS